MSVTNRRGRERLLQTPISLFLNGEPLAATDHMRILGLEISAAGSASSWVRCTRQKATRMLHLFRRIGQKSGGACSRVMRTLVRAIFQPRLVYQAQFQHLTLRDWDRLETANREAMRVITGLPRMTSIPTLQAEAQLNTLDEIVHQRRSARRLKIQSIPAAAALAHYYDRASPLLPRLAEPPPWQRPQATDNRPLGCIKSIHPQEKQANPPLPFDSPEGLQAHVDAGVADGILHTSLVCPTMPSINQTCSYFTEAPPSSLLADLVAIRDGLCALASELGAAPPPRLVLYTDSTQAARELRCVNSTLGITCEVHQILQSFPCPVRVLWTRRSTTTHALADSAAHPQQVVYPLRFLQL